MQANKSISQSSPPENQKPKNDPKKSDPAPHCLHHIVAVFKENFSLLFPFSCVTDMKNKKIIYEVFASVSLLILDIGDSDYVQTEKSLYHSDDPHNFLKNLSNEHACEFKDLDGRGLVCRLKISTRTLLEMIAKDRGKPTGVISGNRPNYQQLVKRFRFSDNCEDQFFKHLAGIFYNITGLIVCFENKKIFNLPDVNLEQYHLLYTTIPKIIVHLVGNPMVTRFTLWLRNPVEINDEGSQVHSKYGSFIRLVAAEQLKYLDLIIEEDEATRPNAALEDPHIEIKPADMLNEQVMSDQYYQSLDLGSSLKYLSRLNLSCRLVTQTRIDSIFDHLNVHIRTLSLSCSGFNWPLLGPIPQKYLFNINVTVSELRLFDCTENDYQILRFFSSHYTHINTLQLVGKKGSEDQDKTLFNANYLMSIISFPRLTELRLYNFNLSLLRQSLKYLDSLVIGSNRLLSNLVFLNSAQNISADMRIEKLCIILIFTFPKLRKLTILSANDEYRGVEPCTDPELQYKYLETKLWTCIWQIFDKKQLIDVKIDLNCQLFRDP